MNTLEKIVQSLELCKHIPDGEFKDSALVWVDGNLQNLNDIFVEPRRYAIDGTYRPAPTLEEIRWELRNLSVSVYENTIVVLCKIDPETCITETVFPDEHDADAALRLWFKIKGIKISENNF